MFMNTRASTRGSREDVPPPPPQENKLKISPILGVIFRLIIFNPYGRVFFELCENLVQIEEL